MAIIEVTLQADRDFLGDHEQVGLRLAELAAQQKHMQERADLFQSLADDAAADRDALGVRARSGLIRFKPALDGLLEAQLEDIQITRDAGVIDKLLTNADAAASRV